MKQCFAIRPLSTLHSKYTYTPSSIVTFPEFPQIAHSDRQDNLILQNQYNRYIAFSKTRDTVKEG